ncbi:MAG: pantoate kinase, partial [Candidatus Jordarchaeales archaeon]
MEGKVLKLTTTSKAFCPAHITCFFQIRDEAKNPLEKGSRGAGMCLDRGVISTVKVEVAEENSVKILVEPHIEDPKVTRSAAEKMIRLANEKYSQNYAVTIMQSVEVPVYAGFGSSGAAAFSTALALNDALKLGLTKNRVGQIAHLVEIENLTGLGDVTAQNIGGVEIRVKEGAPGYGVVDNIPVPENYVVVCGSTGGIETKSVISHKGKREKINEAGEKLVDELLKDATVEKMALLAKEFTASSGLATKKVEETVSELEKAGFKYCGMIMLGESVFCVTTRKYAKKAYKIIKECMPKGFVEICMIDF